MNNQRLMNGKWWWAYLDDSGVIHIKPYTGDAKIQRVEQLPFCKGIFEPFKAESYQHAQKILMAYLDQIQIEEMQRVIKQ
jgi:hypothetical protein